MEEDPTLRNRVAIQCSRAESFSTPSIKQQKQLQPIQWLTFVRRRCLPGLSMKIPTLTWRVYYKVQVNVKKSIPCRKATTQLDHRTRDRSIPTLSPNLNTRSGRSKEHITRSNQNSISMPKCLFQRITCLMGRRSTLPTKGWWWSTKCHFRKSRCRCLVNLRQLC